MVAVSTGIVIFAHGSSVPSANDAVKAIAEAAATAGGWTHAETAFLEAQPSLEEAVGRLVGRGVIRILIVPYFLTLGLHLQRDLPVLVNRLTELHPHVTIEVTP